MGRNIIVLLFWNTIWFYHVLVRESSMSSWGAGFDQSFKMPTSFRIVSFSWGTKTICFWKPSAISSLRKKELKEKEATSCRPSAFWAVECTRGTSLTRVLGSIRTRTGAYWTCLVVFLHVVNKELVRERASAYYLVTPFDTSLCFQTAQSVPCFLCTPTLTFLSFRFCFS